jgi:hypothetical protein
MWLSPNHQDTEFRLPMSLDDKITIFLDRTDGWQLGIAEQCARTIKHSSFAVLHIVFSYFEAIAKYHDGFTKDGQSLKYFKRGFEIAFPSTTQIPSIGREAILHDLYSGVRCGLYHASLTAAHVSVCTLPDAEFYYNRRDRRIFIDPGRLAQSLRTHLVSYGAQLRRPSNAGLRTNFEKRYDYELSQPQGMKW